MITLDPILQAAQDGDNHQPIISLVSKSFAASIPFEGGAFDSLQTSDIQPDMIAHSSGAMVCVAARGDDLILLVTDTDRTQWSVTTILDQTVVCQPAVCELANGDIGVVCATSGYDLYSMTVGIDGTVKTAAALINNYSTWISAPSVVRLATGTYVLVYAYKNGSNQYSISKRTSSDFATWSAASTIAPAGLTNTRRIDNPNIRQLASGQVFMVFDYVNSAQDSMELINCYAMTSDDNGSTWSAPVNMTGYASMSTVGEDPVIAERADGSLEVGFVESKPLLYMDQNTPGWTGQVEIPNMHYNPASGKLIYAHVHTDLGTKILDAVTVVDVATWTIEKNYTTSTDPAINQYFRDGHFWFGQDLGEGKYLCGAIENHLMIIDTETDTITYRNLLTNAGYSLTKNVTGITWDPTNFRWDDGFKYTHVDAVNDRVYVLCDFSYLWTSWFCIGYFDLTEQPDPVTGNYTYYPIVSAAHIGGDDGAAPRQFRVVPDMNMILVPFDFDNDRSTFRIYDINQANTILYEYDSVNNAGFHRNGIYNPVYHPNGHIYGNTVYESGYGQSDRYGLMDIDLASGAIRYIRPSWGTYDNYSLGQKRVLDDGRILMVAAGYGITIFNPTTETWVLYNNSNVPGLTVIGDQWSSIDYDPVTKTIFVSTDDHYENSGIAAFPETGKFRQLKYLTAVYTTAWAFGAADALTNTLQEQMPALAIDDTDALWSVWVHSGLTDTTLYWDAEIADKDLTDYVTNDPVTITWEIDSITTLDFTLSHGHLFDPANSLSTLAPFLKKGRKIEYKLGEKVSGIDYLQDQGTLVIRETSLTYRRGVYPDIKVSCEDLSTIWAEQRITATDHFDGVAPKTILENLLKDHGGLVTADIDMPALDQSHTLYHQFIDQDLREMLDAVAGHFGYFFHFSVDGKATVKKIDLTKDVDHAYPNILKIIDFTPDDSFSSFTNKVVVKGEGRYDLEVLYDLESVGSLSGTVLPFGGTKTERVWFSEDHVRTCRDAYLSVNTSIREYELFLAKGGGNEYISAVDPDEHYVDVTMEAPDLTGVFVALAASIVATGTAAIYCTTNCGPYIFAMSIETQLMGYALGAMAQYDYEVYARPIGHEKQTFQADANDYALQRELDGLVVTEEIEDPFCYEVAHCQRVANHELAVVIAQRNRVSFSKTVHLQDEISDILQIPHLYTGQSIKLFITKLARTYQKGENGAGVIDKIEGWRV